MFYTPQRRKGFTRDQSSVFSEQYSGLFSTYLGSNRSLKTAF